MTNILQDISQFISNHLVESELEESPYTAWTNRMKKAGAETFKPAYNTNIDGATSDIEYAIGNGKRIGAFSKSQGHEINLRGVKEMAAFQPKSTEAKIEKIVQSISNFIARGGRPTTRSGNDLNPRAEYLIDKFDELREQMKTEGTWEAWCEKQGFSTDANGFDMFA